MTRERRRYPRIIKRLEVRREGVSSGHPERTTDISEGGCYIESISNVIIGQQIQFEMQLPIEGWILFSGRILYHHPNVGFGVQFMNLTNEARTRLSCILEAEECCESHSLSCLASC